jgi:hypothetical protein
MLVSWLLFPLLLLALSLGCGLLIARLSGTELPTPLLAPVGFAAVVLVGEIASIDPSLAPLAPAAAIALAVAGFGLGRQGPRRPLDRLALAAALAVFAVYAAPIVLSGEPTFTGYIKLDDTATWLALTDRVAEAGRNLTGLAPSTYEATLDFSLGRGYPIGAFTPLAIGSTLVGRDPAWVFQPYLATMALLLALCLYQLTAGLVRRPPLRAAIAFLAAQPALLFGYYLWGGVKEIAAALLLALLAALVPAAVSAERFGWQAGIPPALAVAATIAVLTAAGSALWLLPILVVGAVALAARSGGRTMLGRLATIAGLALLVSLPWLLDAGLLPEEPGALSDPAELGNLAGPLSGWQAFGIWPTGDFRLRPSDSVATIALIAVTALAGLAGLQRIWSRRALGAGTFVAGLAIGALALIAVGSPWVDGKALATCSVAVLFVACLGAAALWERGLRTEGGVALGLIALGVLWSNALGYREAYLAPSDRLAELERIGERIEGQGPALMTEYEPYGARHFLRDADPESASELRRRLVPLRSGASLETGDTADVDEFALSGLLPYRTLVLRRSPLASRPPLPFRLTEAGDDYEVWQAGAAAPPLEHVSLGGGASPLGSAPCAEVRRLAGETGALHLAAAVRPAATVVPLGRLSLPADWAPGGDGLYATPGSSGIAAGTLELAEAGDYGIWLGGSSRGEVTIAVDGEVVAAAGPEIDHAEQYRQLGSVRLPAGEHEIALAYEEASPLAPGGGGEAFAIGPIVLATATAADSRVEVVSVADADSLCGRPLDWIEALPY